MSSEKQLTKKDYLQCFAFSILIAVAYTIWFIVIVDWIEEGKIDFKILPDAQAQILPFEQQLEQIRAPEECTRKVVQGRSAEIPFSLKVFYDTSRDTKLEFKQQGTTFPIIQRTNQVMTFYTNGTDQYQIYLEVNYPEAKPRQMYIEYLSGNSIVQSEQEKFEGTRFCMNLFANTVLPISIPTKEDIFGESLDFIAKIPAMVIAFNTNTQTSATQIAYMWLLILAVVILSILTLISSFAGSRKFNAKVNDLDDSLVQVNTMTLSMDSLVRSVSEPLQELKEDLKAIMSIPLIKDNIPKKQKESKFKKIISFRKKKDEELMSEAEVIALAEEKPDTETTEEVLRELQSDAEGEVDELIEKAVEPSGGFVITDKKEEKVLPPTPPSPKEEKQIESSPMRLKPEIFDDILKGIDFENKRLKEGMFDRFSYNELNESYGWIVKYRKYMNDKEEEIPPKTLEKQSIIEKIIYEAIFRKMEKHQVNQVKKSEDEKND